VISVIGLIAPHAATDTLQRALHDSDAEVRECARAALSAPTHAMLKVFQPQEQSPLSNPEQAEIADLIAVIQQSDNEEARWNASQKLAECGNRAVSSIVTALQHADSEVRRQLIHTLGRIGKGAREAVHALLPAMQDADAPVRSAAAETLGRLGIVNPSMLQALSKALTDQDSEVRRHSAMTLGRFGQYAHTISIDLQVAALGDSDLKVRNAAHAALQRITESLAKAA
jgi:HEAT repeat protein